MWFVKQRFLNFKDFFPGGIVLNGCFWPEAEDRALRGRNLSAVFRTLNRQVGKPWKVLPSCAPPGGERIPALNPTLRTGCGGGRATTLRVVLTDLNIVTVHHLWPRTWRFDPIACLV